MSVRRLLAALIVVLFVAALPLGSAQGPPEGTPGGPPDEPGAPDQSGTPQENGNGTRPGADSGNGTGPPDGTFRGRPVDIDDAPHGFGVRPAHAGTGRPAFSYDVGRAAMAMDRADAAPLQVFGDALVEFHDEDNDGAYALGESTVQRLALRDLNTTIVGGEETERLVVHALPGGGALTFRFELAPLDDDQATKFDVLITDFPLRGNGTLLALGMRADVPNGMTIGRVAGDAALIGTDTGATPYLSWVPTAVVDGVSLPVGATVHGGPDGGTVYWTYAAGADIVHDPILGVTFVDLERLFDGGAFLAALGAGVVVMAAGFEARRRLRP